jgi:pyruvate formate lyase activating enzyme
MDSMICTSPAGVVFNVMRFSTHDGPGIRTTVFFKGCPLTCWWCHNPESQSFQPEALRFEERCLHCEECMGEECPAEARQVAGRMVTLEELIDEIEKDIIFFDESGGGVTLSGGEPFAQPQFAAALLDACRERGIHKAVETCGFVGPEVFRDLAARTDLLLFDLKLLDPAMHVHCTGVSNELILSNLEAVVARGNAVTVRIPIIPGINDSDEAIQHFASYLGRLRVPVELLPYHAAGSGKYRRLGRDYKAEDTPSPTAADIERFRRGLVEAGLKVRVGGSS